MPRVLHLRATAPVYDQSGFIRAIVPIGGTRRCYHNDVTTSAVVKGNAAGSTDYATVFQAAASGAHTVTYWLTPRCEMGYAEYGVSLTARLMVGDYDAPNLQAINTVTLHSTTWSGDYPSGSDRYLTPTGWRWNYGTLVPWYSHTGTYSLAAGQVLYVELTSGFARSRIIVDTGGSPALNWMGIDTP